MDVRLSPPLSNYFDLNSDYPSLALTREESDSLLDSIYMDSTSSSENYDISSSMSSSFASEDDLTSYSSRTKVNFDPSTFENHLSVFTSDLESVNSAECED